MRDGTAALDSRALNKLTKEAEDFDIYAPALHLLERHHARFNAQQVLEVLDPDLPMHMVSGQVVLVASVPFFTVLLTPIL